MSSLCQKALHIVTELCFAGQVEWEKCSGIFPPDRRSQGGGSTGKPGRGSPPAPVSRASRAALGRGLFGTTRLPTLLLLSTQQLATSRAGCSASVSAPPAQLLPLLWSASCPPAPSRSLASAPPRRALPRLAFPPGVERQARAVAPGPPARRCPRGPLAGGTPAALAFPVGRAPVADGAGRDSSCLNAKTRFANGGCLGFRKQQKSRSG